jgi:hypothetical protein
VVKCFGGMYSNSSTTHTSLVIIGSSSSSTHKYRESLWRIGEIESRVQRLA